MVSLPTHWKQLRPHREQSKLYRSKAKIRVAACGRGSGKTELAKRFLSRYLPVKKPWNDPIYFYGMPTYKQAKRVAWHDLVNFIPKDWVQGKPNISEMVINTVFGSKLYVVGLDQPERLEGVQWDGGVLDECCDLELGSFLYTGLLPALAHRDPFLWMIGVPKRSGKGSYEFKNLYDKGMRGGVLEGTNDRIESYSWKSDTVLTEQQLEFYKHHMDARDYDEQFNATWQSVGGAIFYSFDESVHTRDDVNYDPNLPICVCSDFNVNPMSWCLAQVRDNVVYVFDELFIRNTNTLKTLDILFNKYGHHTAGFEFYGDASGRNRHTSAEFTDYAYISDDSRFVNKKLFYLNKNLSIADRFASCNSMLKNAAGDVRCYISSRCKNLIKDLQVRSYKEGTREPDDVKGSDLGHMSDAFGYFIFRRFPVKLNLNVSKGRVSVGSNRISHLLVS